jgi:hypothetical protein
MRRPVVTLAAAVSSLFLCVGLAAAHGHRHHGHHRGGEHEAAPGFSNADFSGTYANSFQGSIIGAPVPPSVIGPVIGGLSGTGTLTADGKGGISGGSETVSDGTNICTGTLSGTYTVNSDGTGSLTVTFTTSSTPPIPNVGTCPTATTHTAAIVLDGNGHITTSEADATFDGFVATGTLTLQNIPNQGENDDD